MRKRITSIAVAMIMTIGVAGVSHAAKCKGTVESIDGGKMVVELKGKCKAKAGDSVKIKVKKRVVIEGC